MRNRTLQILALAGAVLAPAQPGGAQTKLLRFPDIHGDRVVFTYAGDLWTAPSKGGTAVRLTAHPGVETFGKFSPDGRWIAFTGQYEGDEQVYVIPSTGGVPRQITDYPARGPLTPRWGYDNQVLGWTPDGKSVLFRSLRDGWDLSDSRLYTVPATGGLAQPLALAMPISGAGALSPDGKKVVYTPMARDFRTWKRYKGGWAQDLWIFDLATHAATNITHHPMTDRDPMWIGDKIYFTSDRTGTLNLYSYDVATAALERLTDGKSWDVRWASADAGSGQIVYEQGGELAVYDVKARRATKISIDVPTDGLWNRPSRVSAAQYIEDVALSPRGERALIVARGEIFTVPVEPGLTYNLTGTSGAHERWARWSPDGRRIAFISDATGEDEVYVLPQDGSAPPQALTGNGHGMRYAPEWSADGKRLAFGDKDGRLFVLTVADRKMVEAAHNPDGQIRDYSWSPTGGYLAFTQTNPNGFRSLYIWSAADGKAHRVTDDRFQVGSPAWDPAGRYLYYLSNREFSPGIDAIDTNYTLDRQTGIYALALNRDVPSLFPPRTGEITLEGDAKEPPPEKGKTMDAAAAPEAPPTVAKTPAGRGEQGAPAAARRPADLRIDFDGLGSRVIRVPVGFDNYTGLEATADSLFYRQTPSPTYDREPASKPILHVFSLKDRKESTFLDNVAGFVLSADGKKLAAQVEGELAVYDATPGGKESRKALSTTGLTADRNPVEEWTEVFNEAWRRYRDFFYVGNMNGYDWKAIGDRYRTLLPYVGHRSDLNYLIGEMIAELNNSHSYVSGGDYDLPPRPQVALPGARFELDPKAGRYRIAEILAGQNEETVNRSPLTEVGVDARVGDYVLAIDGVELKADDSPYRLLRGKAQQPVRLTLNGRPTREGARTVVFQPISSEIPLRYLAWIEANRKRVDELSHGRIGYLHIPDMGGDGLREFIKAFYPQLRKEALIVDVRSNGGGNVSQMLIERLRRKVLSVDFTRATEDPQPYPSAAFDGPMVALSNESTSSDGDIFCSMFQKAGLGPVIGTRTWGGVVGIGNTGPMIDGGTISVPESATASPEGQWIIEGHGVDPDIVVENDPKSVIDGKDPQLERGVAELLKKLPKEPRKLLPHPPDPVKTPEKVAEP